MKKFILLFLLSSFIFADDIQDPQIKPSHSEPSEILDNSLLGSEKEQLDFNDATQPPTLISETEDSDLSKNPQISSQSTLSEQSLQNISDVNLKQKDVSHNLTPLAMYKSADKVVKFVMIVLFLSSIVSWVIFIVKNIELFIAKKSLIKDLSILENKTDLNGALANVQVNTPAFEMLNFIKREISVSNLINIEDRVERGIANIKIKFSRKMNSGTGVLASIGSISPFIGLFGTVWGIMNSFIGIAQSQSTHLAVVAPGIAEALLATALGLVAAIPAVLIYNFFARSFVLYNDLINFTGNKSMILLSRFVSK